MTPIEMRAKLDQIARELGEHCDSVKIFVTLPSEGGNSTAIDSGCGNFYAQLGQVVEWLSIQDQYQRNWAIRKDSEES